PDEIKDAVREGVLSERDTRVYQGLTAVQQRSLHRARMAGELNPAEMRQLSRLLREAPEMTVAMAARLLQQTVEEEETDDQRPAATAEDGAGQSAEEASSLPVSQSPNLDPLRPARVGAPTSIERLDWVRGH